MTHWGATHWVLLRGLARERGHWGDLPDTLARAMPGADVTALDLPGNGALHALASPRAVADMAEHARGQWRQRGVDTPVHLLAMSLGGMVAIDWATRYPKEIAAAVLVNTSAGGVQPFYRRLKPGAWWPLLRAVWPGTGAEERERTIARLTTRTHVDASAAPAAWLALRAAHPVHTLNALRQMMAALRYRAPAAPPAARVLLLASARDRLVDPRCSHSLALAWGASVAEHPTAGHDLALDEPDWVSRTIANWLARDVLTAAIDRVDVDVRDQAADPASDQE